jgi:hypothetical protein
LIDYPETLSTSMNGTPSTDRSWRAVGAADGATGRIIGTVEVYDGGCSDRPQPPTLLPGGVLAEPARGAAAIDSTDVA